LTGQYVESENLKKRATRSPETPIPCKLNTFRRRVKNVLTSKGIVVGIECKYVMWSGVK
jgi:hypothetical protein